MKIKTKFLDIKLMLAITRQARLLQHDPLIFFAYMQWLKRNELMAITTPRPLHTPPTPAEVHRQTWQIHQQTLEEIKRQPTAQTKKALTAFYVEAAI